MEGSRPDDGNMIDIMEMRLLKQIFHAETDLEAEVAETLYEMYRLGAVEVEMKEGKMLFSCPNFPEDDLGEDTWFI